MELSYDEIRRIHRLEKNTSRLVEVSPEFYAELSSFLKEERESYLKSLNDLSFSKARDFTNLKKMLEEIFSIREKKILNQALICSKTKEINEEHMASQEKEIFRKFLQILEEHNKVIIDLFSNEKTEIIQKPGKDLNNLSVKILSDVPSFIGTDMKEYGPFTKGKIITVPLEIAKLLDSRNLAEIQK